MKQTRKQNDSMLELQRQHNEEILTLSNELEVRIESAKRELHGKEDERE